MTENVVSIRYSPSAPFTSLLRIRFSLLSFASPTRGGRSAGGARMHARHPSRRVMTDAQTPLSMRKPGEPALRSWRTTGGPGVRSICANRASPACMRRLAFPATGRSPFGAPRGISGPGPGPCSPLSGIPSRIVRQPHMPHGSSLPGGAGLANLPGAAANRLRGRHSLAPPCRIASRSAPHERGCEESSMDANRGQQENANRS